VPSTRSAIRDRTRPASIRPARVLVACPDARPPAYEAVAGLHAAGMLDAFLTGFYHNENGFVARFANRSPEWSRQLSRRNHRGIPADRVWIEPLYDAALAMERRWPRFRRQVAMWRTRHFDQAIARQLNWERPDLLLAFSDVASELAIPHARELGIPTIVSMVHGDVREEQSVMDKEARRDPNFFKLYLGDSPVDREEMAWLHARRLRDLALADRVLVPSEHIAETLENNGTPRSKVRVIPYAADIRRFHPDPLKAHGSDCTFLFAGGISQRKGIKYLLEAWKRVKRTSWRLQLLGAIPRDPGPLAPLLDDVEILGRVPHGEVPSKMASADVFVFPSLFEGSAVVTYEALACGLPCIVTEAAGSVVRDGQDGFIVPEADVATLATMMDRLGNDASLRREMSRSARSRAEEYDWPRYHRAVNQAIRDTIAERLPTMRPHLWI
jgi:starch synthase